MTDPIAPERYSLLFDMSMMWDEELLAKGKIRVRFYRDKPTRIGVLPRRGAGSEVRWFPRRDARPYRPRADPPARADGLSRVVGAQG
jgi:carotenoid cleavage dioxygenase-like enzyme